MKIKVGQILEAYTAANRAIPMVKGFKGGYDLVRLIKELDVLRDQFNKKHQEILKQYGEPSKPDSEEAKRGIPFIVEQNTPKWDQYVEETNKLLAEEIDQEFQLMNHEDFENEEIPGTIIAALMPFLK